MNFKKTHLTYIILFSLGLIFTSGCARTRHAVPYNLTTKATVHGFKDIRYYADSESNFAKDDMLESIEQESPNDYMGKNGVKVYSVAAISGGAANGAYGAGILKGWSESGTRPRFKAVTGISTGALTAPIVFLGSDYDYMLEDLYTTNSTEDVVVKRGPLGMLFSDSLISNRPLQKLIKRMVTDEVVQGVAEEHKKGRRLYIGTTDLDAQRLVIWNMGKIACVGGKKAKKLFAKVLIASSSIPIAFPPQFFKVEADGKKYDEMHVDGGAVAQVFGLYVGVTGISDEVEKTKIDIDLYVIRNGYVTATYKEVDDNISSIADRSLDIMVNAQGVGDIYRLYTFAEAREHDFYLAYIPPEHKSIADEMFDPDEMKKLFNLGREEAKNGYPWKRKPPYLQDIERK